MEVSSDVVQWHELRRALEREERFPAFLSALQKKMVKKRPAMKKGAGRGGAHKRITFEGMVRAESVHSGDDEAGANARQGPATAANVARTLLGSKAKVQQEEGSEEEVDEIDDGEGGGHPEVRASLWFELCFSHPHTLLGVCPARYGCQENSQELFSRSSSCSQCDIDWRMQHRDNSNSLYLLCAY
jgi:hypothetical protein